MVLFLTKAHVRKFKAKQRREARHIVSIQGYKDPEVRELVNRLSPGMIALSLQNRFGTFDTHVCDNYDLGEVLSDYYGEGTLQQVASLVQEEMEDTR